MKDLYMRFGFDYLQSIALLGYEKNKRIGTITE